MRYGTNVRKAFLAVTLLAIMLWAVGDSLEWWRAFPRWMVAGGFVAAYLIVLPPLLATLRDRSDARWRRSGRCPSCGYDRRGLAADAKCPECGTVQAPASK